MEVLISRLNVYVIPPLLSLIVGVALAVMSLVKGKFKQENLLFSLVCIWWTLMAPIFLCHQLFRGDLELLMTIERSVHFIYVYLPAINLLFVYKIFGLKNKILLIVTFIFCFIISLTTLTDYYFYGFHIYDWGYSIKGGPAFQLFGIYGFFTTIYILVYFFRKIKKTENSTERLKIRYILLSFIATAILTMLNIPAISGIDFYAYGNFMFVPLSLLAYGVLRYRLMDIRSVLHISLVWGITSSLFIIPNVVILYLIRPYLAEMATILLFFVVFLWFLINLIYLNKVQPLIDQYFNRQKINLRKVEVKFIENISYLKTLKGLVNELTETVKKSLNLKGAEFYLKIDESNDFKNVNGDIFSVDESIKDWFVADNQSVEKDTVLTDPYYNYVRNKLRIVFEKYDAYYIVPFVQNFELEGLLFLGERYNLRPFNFNEKRFLNGIRTAVSISISNSIMYQELSDLKDTLEQKVERRTEELLMAKEEVEAINENLTNTNTELIHARRMAEMDMAMAINVQKSFFPENPPQTDKWEIAFEFRPMSGVSGDFYDFYMDDKKLMGLSLLDVSGHGIASGLITMIARSILNRNFNRHRDKKLNFVFEQVNQELIEELNNVHNYLTGVLLRFDDNIVEYVNAGHPDLLLLQKNSKKSKIINYKDRDFKGIFLGVKEMDFPFRVLKFKMQKDDVVLAYSDCLIEGENQNKEWYSMERLKETLSGTGDGTAQEILDFILEDYFQFTGTEKLTDDLTVIVLKRK